MKKYRLTAAIILTLSSVFFLSCEPEQPSQKSPEISGQPAPIILPSRSSIYPRSAAPSDTVFVFDGFGADPETKVLLTTLQGIVNRDKPELYLILKKPPATAAQFEKTDVSHDLHWLNWLVDNRYIHETVYFDSIELLLKHYNLKKVIQVDPDFAATLNIATMLSGVKGYPVAYPEQVKKYDLEVVEDLKGRWQSNIEAYEWAFENLWPQMDHTVISCIAPDPKISHLRDYLVAKKIFTFWGTGAVDGNDVYSNPEMEKQMLRKIMAKIPVNIPVIGFPWAGKDVGMGEYEGVVLFSNYGKFLVAMDWKTNLSVWTGLDSKKASFSQPAKRGIKLEDDKIYVSFLMSDGDNLNTFYDYFYTTDYWQSPLRGQIPMAWTIGPSIIDLQRPLVDYYYSSMKPTDSFGVAVSGIGYIYLNEYGKAFPEHKEQIWKGFLELTDQYMKKMDMAWIWLMQKGLFTEDVLLRYTQNIDSLEILLPGYGTSMPYEKANYIIDNVVAFEPITKGNPKIALEEIMPKIPEDKPAFMHVFLHNWSFKYEDVKKLADSLPENVVFVRPDEMAQLYRQHINKVKN